MPRPMRVPSSDGSGPPSPTAGSTRRRSAHCSTHTQRNRRIDMKRVLNSAALALLVAARAAAAQGLTIDWSRTAVTGGRALAGGGADGATAVELRAGSPAGTSIHLVTIDHPPVTGGAYVVSGQLRYDGVEGQGYLEMWSVFPDGQRFFSRTLGTAGTLAALHGASGWRRVELPLDPSGAPTPSRLEINLLLPAPGTGWVGPPPPPRGSGGAPGAAGARAGRPEDPPPGGGGAAEEGGGGRRPAAGPLPPPPTPPGPRPPRRPPVGERRAGQAEMLLGRLLDPLRVVTTALLERRAPH